MMLNASVHEIFDFSCCSFTSHYVKRNNDYNLFVASILNLICRKFADFGKSSDKIASLPEVSWAERGPWLQLRVTCDLAE